MVGTNRSTESSNTFAASENNLRSLIPFSQQTWKFLTHEVLLNIGLPDRMDVSREVPSRRKCSSRIAVFGINLELSILHPFFFIDTCLCPSQVQDIVKPCV